MPSTSEKQARTMRAIAHGWKPPKDSDVADIPVDVARDFMKADQAKAKRKRLVSAMMARKSK